AAIEAEGRIARQKFHLIAEVVVEIAHGSADSLIGERELDANVRGPDPLGFEIRIAVGKRRSEALAERRNLDALAEIAEPLDRRPGACAGGPRESPRRQFRAEEMSVERPVVHADAGSREPPLAKRELLLHEHRVVVVLEARHEWIPLA